MGCTLEVYVPCTVHLQCEITPFHEPCQLPFVSNVPCRAVFQHHSRYCTHHCQATELLVQGALFSSSRYLSTYLTGTLPVAGLYARSWGPPPVRSEAVMHCRFNSAVSRALGWSLDSLEVFWVGLWPPGAARVSQMATAGWRRPLLPRLALSHSEQFRISGSDFWTPAAALTVLQGDRALEGTHQR